MSKITFRADDELVERVEEDGASKSEVMREALRSYLDTERESDDSGSTPGATRVSDDGRAESKIDESLTELVDELIAERLRGFVGDRVDAHLEEVTARGDRSPEDGRQTRRERPSSGERQTRREQPSRGNHRERPGRENRRRPERSRETPSVVVNVGEKSPADGVSYDESATDGDCVSDDRRERGRQSANEGEEAEPPRDRSDDGSSPARESRPKEGTQTGRARESTTNSDTDEQNCGRCGSTLSGDHVYCPNCGEKATRRLFCDCGDEIRSDWSFCPGCGRRTAAADVLDERPDGRGHPGH